MFSLPFFGKRTKSVKDHILFTLLEDFPLKTRILHNRLQKRYGLSVTYQGVHKAITQLREDGILSRSEKGYTLNENWVKHLELFIEMFKANYSREENIIKELSTLRKDGDIRIITANSFFEVYKTQMVVRNRFRKKFENVPLQERPIRVTHSHQVFRFILNPMDAHEGHLIDSYRFNHYYIIQGNSKVDKESVKLIHSYPGLKGFDRFLLGTALPRGCHLAVYDDLIFEVHLPINLKEKICYYFNTAQSISTFDTLNFFRNVSVAPHRVKIILCKDRQLATEITEETLEYFKKSKIGRADYHSKNGGIPSV